MLNIVLFGPPGAGKGTQARLLVEKYGLAHISTGEVIREEIRMGTGVGISVKEFIERGELAPDDLVMDLVADFMEHQHNEAGYIYDGFPRTTRQAEEFDRMLEGHGVQVDIMLSLLVPEEELVKRLLLRGMESGRADDFTEEIIRNRIDIYNSQTAIVAQYYEAQGKYRPIKGTGTVDEVFTAICDEIDSLTGKEPK